MKSLDKYVIAQLKKEDNRVMMNSSDNFDSKILSLILREMKQKEQKINESTEFIFLDDSFTGDGIIMSVYNAPLSNEYEKLKDLANELNKKFKKTNVSYIIKPSIGFVFIITISFISYGALNSNYDMLFYADDEIGEDKELNAKIEGERKQKSDIEGLMDTILIDMKLALLETSIYIDERVSEWE